MSGESNGTPHRYKLSISAALSQRIEDLYALALASNRADSFEAALRTIVRRLQGDPLAFGELIRHHKIIRVLEHSARVSPLMVKFGVHEVLPIVFLKELNLLPNE